MPESPRVIVLGAGASGLGLAWRLASKGVAVDVVESAAIVGGLAGTIREEGYCLDFGPHSFFSEDNQILEQVLQLFDHQLRPQPRKAKFYYNGRYLDYPLTPAGVLLQMGLLAGARATLSFLWNRLIPRGRGKPSNEDQTVEQWAQENFGPYLYRTFFKPYTEQFWKVPCTELSVRSIPTHTRMSFLKTLRLLVGRRLSGKDASLEEREKLPTYYPQTGFGEIAERIAVAVEHSGGRIHLESRATLVEDLADGKVAVEYQRQGATHRIAGQFAVSTIPLPSLMEILRPSPSADVITSAERLDYRALLMLGLVTEKQDILDAAYVYLLNRPYNRISEMNKFSPGTSPAGENVLCLEICALRDSAAYRASKEELFDMCAASLAADGILAPGDVKRIMLLRAPYAYPIYRKDYAAHLTRVLDEISRRRGLATLGRTGEFMYMDSDKCLRRAFDLADKLIRQLG